MSVFELGLQSAAGLWISDGQTLPTGSPGLWGMEMPPQVGCNFSPGVVLARVSPGVQRGSEIWMQSASAKRFCLPAAAALNGAVL